MSGRIRLWKNLSQQVLFTWNDIPAKDYEQVEPEGYLEGLKKTSSTDKVINNPLGLSSLLHHTSISVSILRLPFMMHVQHLT